MTDAIVGFLAWYVVTCFQFLAAACFSALSAVINGGLFSIMVGAPIWAVSVVVAALRKVLGRAGRTRG